MTKFTKWTIYTYISNRPINTNQQQGSDDKEGSLSNMRRLSLPKVTQLGDDVILVEQSKRSREIFI